MDVSHIFSFVLIYKFGNDILTVQIWSNFAVSTIEYKTYEAQKLYFCFNFWLFYDLKS